MVPGEFKALLCTFWLNSGINQNIRGGQEGLEISTHSSVQYTPSGFHQLPFMVSWNLCVYVVRYTKWFPCALPEAVCHATENKNKNFVAPQTCVRFIGLSRKYVNVINMSKG